MTNQKKHFGTPKDNSCQFTEIQITSGIMKIYEVKTYLEDGPQARLWARKLEDSLSEFGIPHSKVLVNELDSPNGIEEVKYGK